MKYVVRVTETLAHTVIVEAESEWDAENKVDQAYYDGQITLDYDDFDEYGVQTIREATDFDNGFYDVLEVEECSE